MALQYAFMNELSRYGIDLDAAGQAAERLAPRSNHTGYLSHYYGEKDRPPLMLFCRFPLSGRPLELVSSGSNIDVKTTSTFWEGCGFWINYSALQRRVVSAYQELIIEPVPTDG
jgi:hypothetical protein